MYFIKLIFTFLIFSDIGAVGTVQLNVFYVEKNENAKKHLIRLYYQEHMYKKYYFISTGVKNLIILKQLTTPHLILDRQQAHKENICIKKTRTNTENKRPNDG